MRSYWLLILPVACTGQITGPLMGGPKPKAPDAGACAHVLAAGHVPIHRLSNVEYDNTVRDLLLSKLQPATAFPADTFGASGFTNDSESLSVFDQLVSDYYVAAQQLAAEVIASKGVAAGAYAFLSPCGAQVSASTANACATATVSALATRAFRRPVTADELSRLLGVFNQSGSFDTGLSDVLIAVLMNPKFLFVSIVADSSRMEGVEFGLSDYALASRLSYFLWQSMPDAELLQLAAAGTLHPPATLKAQVQRMLADPRTNDALRTLRDEYAGLAILSGTPINGLDDALRLAMIQETDLFLQDLVASDKSFVEILAGKTTRVNGALAKVYGIAFPGPDPSAFVEVPLPAQRTGLVTQASILTATAGAIDVTHPVKRGKWVTGQILCSAPPPPPPNIPLLPPPDAGTTIRSELDAHAANPVCNGCHQVMDPIGLSLENYDSQGAWRTTYPGSALPIDASGTLPNGGPTFTNAIDLYGQLAATDAVRSCFPRQLLGFALTRAASRPDDVCLASQLGAESGQPTSRFSDLILGIVQSPPFQKQTGEAP